ncbi:hypothetical protein BS78_04G287700 [Paspalum vaginatum]|nr:hypothetical protein BS78_04G287700 [Paspalum vaginatum]
MCIGWWSPRCALDPSWCPSDMLLLRKRMGGPRWSTVATTPVLGVLLRARPNIALRFQGRSLVSLKGVASTASPGTMSRWIAGVRLVATAVMRRDTRHAIAGALTVASGGLLQLLGKAVAPGPRLRPLLLTGQSRGRSASTGPDAPRPVVCATPSPPPSPPSPPVGDMARRPSSGFVIIPHSPEIEAKEARLARALVATVGGTHPVISVEQVAQYLVVLYGVAFDRFTVQSYQPKDFLVVFNDDADRDRVLSGAPPSSSPFRLVWKRWSRLSLAVPLDLRFHVLLLLRGLSAHVWSLEVARCVLGTSCAQLELAPESVSRTDLGQLVVVAWCIHPDCVPAEVTILLPEAKKPHDLGNLFLKEHEMIQSKLSSMTYRVSVQLLEWQDWTPGDDGNATSSDNWDSDVDEYPGFGEYKERDPWRRKRKFDAACGGASLSLGPS